MANLIKRLENWLASVFNKIMSLIRAIIRSITGQSKNTSQDEHTHHKRKEEIVREKKLYSRGPTNNEINTEGISRLVREARENAQFFHDLVWNTERTITSLDYLTRQEKATILSVDPESVVVGLVTGGRGTSPIEVCGVSCAGSCGNTCAASCVGSCGGSCGGSCDNSCGGTCGGSCGASCGNSCADSCVVSCAVSGDFSQREEFVSQPAERLQEQIIMQIRRELNTKNFSRFER